MKYLQIVLEYPDDLSLKDIKNYAQAALELQVSPKVKAPKSKMKAVGNVRKPRIHSDRIA